MTSGREQPDGRDPTDQGESEFTIARSNALVPLLAMFALTVLWVVLVILRSQPTVPPHGAPADKAFGPADFPAVFVAREPVAQDGEAKPPHAGLLFPVPTPPFSEGVFPCSDCHADMQTDPTRRVLTMHEEIVFEHDAEHRWCLDCHDPDDRDQLHLANGTRIPFTESYLLCGQCHGTQFRDWRSGIHGKRTGSWDGPKQYLLCVHCHSPHSPAYKPIAPLPPPVRPQFLHLAGRGAEATARTPAHEHEERADGDATR